MSKLQAPWLDEDARSLVRRTATIERAPVGARGRVLAGVEAVVGSAGEAAGPRDAHRPSSAPLLPGGTRALAIAAAFALGGGLGALVMHRFGHAPEATVAPPVERVAPAVVEAPAVPPPAPDQVPESASPVRRPMVAAPAASPKAPASHALDPLADERTLLDEARVAVEREDGAAALAATDAHARRYPRGVLVQEREAIAVRALVLLGRTDEARARVERFREHFPDSLLLPALESTAGVAPAL